MAVTGQREIEERWRNRLHAAEQRYRMAAANYRRVDNENKKRTATASNSMVVLQEALHMENIARAEYLRVLQIFTGLVLNKRIPDDEARSA